MGTPPQKTTSPQRVPRRMDGIEEMLGKMVAPDGVVRGERAMPLLDLVANNLLHVRNLSATNIAAVFWQRPTLRWPVFSRAAKDANLELKPLSKGKGAWILVPRDLETVAEMENAQKGGTDAARQASLDGVEAVEGVASEMRAAVDAALDEKARVAEQLRQLAPQVKCSPEAAARLPDLRASLGRCDRAAKDGQVAAEHLSGHAAKLRETVRDKGASGEIIANTAQEIGLALVQLAGEGEAVEKAHAALGRAARLAKGERRRCTGEVVRFDQVRCVYDLERDFQRNEALSTALQAREEPSADAGQNAAALLAALRSRGEAPTLQADRWNKLGDGARVTILSHALVKGINKELECSPQAAIFATYFVAKAMGATEVKLPTVQIAAAGEGRDVSPRETLATLREAISIARNCLNDVVRARGEKDAITAEFEQTIQTTPETAVEEGAGAAPEALPVAAPSRGGRGR